MIDDAWNSRFDLWAIRPFEGSHPASTRKILLFCSAYLSKYFTLNPCSVCQKSIHLFEVPRSFSWSSETRNPEWREKWEIAYNEGAHNRAGGTPDCRARMLYQWTKQAISGMSTFLELWFNIVWRTGGFSDHNQFFRFTDLDREGRQQYFISHDIDLDSWEWGMTYVREIFLNPSFKIPVAPKWITTDALELARSIDSDRGFDRLPLLADKLEKNGCERSEILEHCRTNRSHVRGCWVIDLLLGQE